MLDIRFIRENPELVRENIKKKFQDAKLPLVDEVLELDEKKRAAITEASELRAQRNTLSKQVGMLMGQAKKDPSKLEEAEAIKAKVKAQAERLAELEKLEVEYEEKLHQDMLQIPNIIDPSVPIGPDDSHNVEVQRFGEPVVPDYPIPYHVDIMESFDGIDLDAAGRVSGNGFYYLLGDIARLHEAVRDGVGIDDGCPEAAQDGRGRALAARDAARQTDAFHSAPPLLKNKNQTMDKMIVAGNCKKMMKVPPQRTHSLPGLPFGKGCLTAGSVHRNACPCRRRWSSRQACHRLGTVCPRDGRHRGAPGGGRIRPRRCGSRGRSCRRL